MVLEDIRARLRRFWSRGTDGSTGGSDVADLLRRLQVALDGVLSDRPIRAAVRPGEPVVDIEYGQHRQTIRIETSVLGKPRYVVDLFNCGDWLRMGEFGHPNGAANRVLSVLIDRLVPPGTTPRGVLWHPQEMSAADLVRRIRNSAAAVLGGRRFSVELSSKEAVIHFRFRSLNAEIRQVASGGKSGFVIRSNTSSEKPAQGCFTDPWSAIKFLLAQAVETLDPDEKGIRATPSAGRHGFLEYDDLRVPRVLIFGDQWQTPYHRSGWGYVLGGVEELTSATGMGVVFDGFIEYTFAWGGDIRRRAYERPWVGVIHNPADTPAWFGEGKSTNEVVFDTLSWRLSLPHCRGLFTLSRSHQRAIQDRFDFPVEVLTHPTETPELKFTMEAYRSNPDRKLVQVGWFLRDPRAIYDIQVSGLRKVRLSGGSEYAEGHTASLLHAGLDHDSVEVLGYLENDQYDELLSKNIVLLKLVAASANNAVIECVVRHTPLVVNRLSALEEYLGSDYPLFYDDLEEAGRLAQDEQKIHAAHRHLAELPKERFSLEFFVRSLATSDIYRSISPHPFVIFAHARSGSTTLRDCLHAHPHIRVMGEPFNPDRREWGDPSHPVYHDRIDGTEESLDRCVESILRQYTGFKHLDYQLIPELNNRLLGSGLHVVFLYRRNLLKAVVSNRISIAAQHWRSNREILLAHEFEPLSIDEIRWGISELRGKIASYRAHLQAQAVPCLEIAYEDLLGDGVDLDMRLDRIEPIFEFLNALPPMPKIRERYEPFLDPEHRKLNTVETYRRVPNIDEVEDALGTELDGYLFRPDL